jgi:hypothetical protein
MQPVQIRAHALLGMSIGSGIESISVARVFDRVCRNRSFCTAA